MPRKIVHGKVLKNDNTCIQWLQTRIIHRILVTNSLLLKWTCQIVIYAHFAKCQKNELPIYSGNVTE